MRQHAMYGEYQIRSLVNQIHNINTEKEINFSPSQLSTIKAKTFIIHGDHDMVFPVVRALEMYQAIPKTYLWVCPNSEHAPQDRYPEVFKQWTLEFSRGEWDKK